MDCSLSSPLRGISVSMLFSGDSFQFSDLRLRRMLVDFRPSRCKKMFVRGLEAASPEAKASKNLNHFFTFVAFKIVLAQLQKSCNREAYDELMDFATSNSLNDGDQFCRRLMRESSRHKGLALRILEVRSAYAKRDFEWDNLKKLALKMVDESNTRLMREYVLETSRFEEVEEEQ